MKTEAGGWRIVGGGGNRGDKAPTGSNGVPATRCQHRSETRRNTQSRKVKFLSFIGLAAPKTGIEKVIRI